jgi:two-component sensor histidine kinase/PAS domain-containing protein
MNATDQAVGLANRLTAAVAQAPFAVLIFQPDEKLTLVWRNVAHADMTGTHGLAIAGRGMFEAFPPNDEDEGAAAKAAILSVVKEMHASLRPVTIGPYRYDLKLDDGAFVERHWRIQMSPIVEDGRLNGVMQIAQDITDEVFQTRLSDALRRAAATTAGVSYFSYDPQTDVFQRTGTVDEMFGFEPGEAGDLAAPFFARVHPDDLPGVLEEVTRVMASPHGAVAAFDYRVPSRAPNRPERFLRIRAEVVVDPVDRREKLVGTFVDLTDFETQRRELHQQLKLREALANEANHRIKNSLAIALSMVRIKKRAILRSESNPDSEVLSALSGLESRISAISGVHGLMQVDASRIDVSLNAILKSLVDQFRSSAGIAESSLRLSLSNVDCDLNSDLAVSLGIILNELLTNAVKYGLNQLGVADIMVAASMNDGVQEILISNRIEKDLPIDDIASTKVGSELVQQLAASIGANLKVQNDALTYAVRFTFRPAGSGNRQAG